jgi:hypothetical protein
MFLALGYFILSCVIMVIQNIIFFSSADFSNLVDGTNQDELCFENDAYYSFIRLYVCSEIIPLYGVAVSYLIMETVLRRFRPQIKTFRYNKQTKMVKFVTLDGYTFKMFIVSIDCASFVFSLVAASTLNSNHANINACQNQYPTLYSLLLVITVMGFFTIFRVVYFIFPHWTGPHYYNNVQARDLRN